MSDLGIGMLCLAVTLALYFANKQLYRRVHRIWLMPLVLTPLLLVALLLIGHISYREYMGESHWLLWLLGPATIAFAVPVYENGDYPPSLAVVDGRCTDLDAGGGAQLGVAGAAADPAGKYSA